MTGLRPVFVLSRGYLLDGEVQGAFTSLDLAQDMTGIGHHKWQQLETTMWFAPIGDGNLCWSVREVELVDAG